MEFDGGKPYKGAVTNWALFADLTRCVYFFAGRNQAGQKLRSSPLEWFAADGDDCLVKTRNSTYRLTGPQDYEFAQTIIQAKADGYEKIALWSQGSVEGKPVRATLDQWELFVDPDNGRKVLCGLVQQSDGSNGILTSSEVLGITANNEVVTRNSRYKLGLSNDNYTRYTEMRRKGYVTSLTQKLKEYLQSQGYQAAPIAARPELGRG